MDGVQEFVVLGVRLSEKTGCPVMLLKERENGRVFGIGLSKANMYGALAVTDPERWGKGCSRPLSHELTIALAEAAAFRVERVVIDRLTAEGIFCATLEVRSRAGGEVARLDARPSDAIPIAVCTGAPVVVADEVTAKVDFYSLDDLPYREVRPGDLTG